MEPKDFFRTLVRRKRTVITALVVVVGVALFGSMKKLPTYSAACKVRIAAVAPGGGGQINEDPTKNPTEIYASFKEMTQILMSPVMAGAVATRLNVPYGQVAGKISAEHAVDTGIFDLTTLYTEPAFAVKMCDAYMAEFLSQRLAIATEKVEQSKTVLKARKAKYEAELRSTVERVRLEKDQQAQNLLRLVEQSNVADITKVQKDILDLENALEIGLEGGGAVVSPAGGGIKVGPNHKQDAIIGLIVGLIFGAGLALVREYMDDTVRDKESALREIGLPVLASMPAGQSDDPFGEEDGGSVEAARMLRTNLASQGLGGDVQAVVVTSTLSKRNPATLVALAGAIAEAGRTVLVIGADLRQARIHEAFGVGNAVGLTNVIRGQVTFDKAIRPVPGQMGIYIMPTGPVIGNPGELLSTDEMAMVIRRARKWADIVLIDAPPVLAAADASVLGAYADGVLLVMSAGQTLRSQANEAKEQLKAAGSKLLGAVLYGSADGGQSNGKGMSLATLRRGDDGGMPPLSPYGGFESGGGYDSYGGGYGGGASQSAGFGSYANADYDEESYDDYDDFDDAPVAPRARSTNGKNKNGRGNGGSTKKRPPAKKSVAASSPARMRMEDREIGRAPRRGTALTLDAREAGSRNGQVKPRPRPKAQSARPAPAARKAAAPARKAAPARNAAPARKSISARQAAPARKSVSARKAAPAGKSVSARKSAPARKSSSPRQTPRSNRYDRDLF